MALQVIRQPLVCLRIMLKLRLPLVNKHLYTTIDAMDAFTNELLQKHKYNNNALQLDNFFGSRCFMENDKSSENTTAATDWATTFQNLLSKNKDKQIENIIIDCIEKRIYINGVTLKKLLKHYSTAGRPDIVLLLQRYCFKVDPNLFKRNGEYLHYLAKAQCMKGNSDKGLEVLQQAYNKYKTLQSLYRLIFKELINDSVLNRSEASLVIFKKYVLEFSRTWSEHYPLLCLWHSCWSSTWFSDQMLANELIEQSSALREIVQEKAASLSLSVLRDNYNEDAVYQLLQMFLKYNMMAEYTKVLQILFIYKMKNHDMRGCTEILKNCETLGISLPSYIHGRYIKMLITGCKPDKQKSKPQMKTFKLKF